MKRFGLAVVLCVLPAAAWGQDKQDKPILVLDAGGHTAMVNKVLFTPDGRELITVSDDKTIRFWDVSTGEPLRVLRPPVGKGPEGMLYAAALSPDGKTLAVGGYGWTGGDHRIYLISLHAGRIERVLTGPKDVIRVLAFSPDGKTLASGSADKTARLWEVATGRCTATLEGHSNDVYGVAFSPDGRRLATASYDKTGRVWSVASGESEAVLRGHDKEVGCVAWSPDGRTLATGSKDHSIRLWDPDGSPRKHIDKLGNGITSLTFTADSRRLLFTRGSGGDHICSLLDLDSGEEQVRFTKHTNAVLDGELSPVGKLAATTGGDDNETYLWKTDTAAAVQRLAGRGRTTWSAAWSPDGKSVAWGNSSQGSVLKETMPLDRSFRLSDLEFASSPDDSFRRSQRVRGSLSLEADGRTTVAVKQGGETLATLRLEDEYDQVRCFTLLPGDRAAVGASFGLYVFDARSGKLLRKFQGHTGVVWAVAPSPDRRFLLSASDDQTLRLWDPERDEPLLSLFFAGDEWIAWTPEGYYAASPGGENLMGWHLNNGKDQLASFYPAEKFRKSLYRPDVIKRLLVAGSVERALALADEARGKSSERTEVAKVLPPTVAITAPARSGTRVAQAEITVEATARSVGEHPVTALRLLIDGRPPGGANAVKHVAEPKLGEVRESWMVTLTPGRHKLRVLADSAVSQGPSEDVEVIYEGAAEEKPELPRLYVLAIGVSRYQDEGLRLEYSAKDAQVLTDTLRQHSKPLFRDIQVKLLVDGEASRAGMLKGLTWLRQQATQRDYAVVFFSGHGDKDADGSLYFLPADADPKDLASSAVPSDQVKKMLVALPGKVVWLLDACHSGGVDAPRRKGGSLTDDLVRDLVTEENGLVVMCSSTGREFSLENNEFRQGTFTLALVEGLSGKAAKGADGAVYLHHLDAYVTDRVKELTRGRQHPVTAKPASIRSFPLAKP